MTNLTRRGFLTAAAAWLAGCATVPEAPPGNTANAGVRAPSIGQWWTFAKRDLVTGAFLDEEEARIVRTGHITEIAMRSVRTGSALPGEIHEPWGWLRADPHWGDAQVYRDPLPLWPPALRPGWTHTFDTEYRTAEDNESLPWQLTMRTHGWESVTVPAGRFQALRYTNLVNFRYTEVSEKVAARRMETLWFAPEVGRFVARESRGTFYQDVAEEFNEPGHRWELLAFA